MFKIIRF